MARKGANRWTDIHRGITMTTLGEPRSEKGGTVERPSLFNPARRSGFVSQEIANIPKPAPLGVYWMRAIQKLSGLIEVEHDGKLAYADKFQSPGVFAGGCSMHEYLETRYFIESQKLHFTPAGMKAQELFEEFITERMKRELRKQLYFDMYLHGGPTEEEGPIRWSRSVWVFRFTIQPVDFKLVKWWNPDVDRWIESNYTFCWHPEEVVPPGDLLLSYWLQLMGTRDSVHGLLKQANW